MGGGYGGYCAGRKDRAHVWADDRNHRDTAKDGDGMQPVGELAGPVKRHTGAIGLGQVVLGAITEESHPE